MEMNLHELKHTLEMELSEVIQFKEQFRNSKLYPTYLNTEQLIISNLLKIEELLQNK